MRKRIIPAIYTLKMLVRELVSITLADWLLLLTPMFVGVSVLFLFTYLSWDPSDSDVLEISRDYKLSIPNRTLEDILTQPAPSRENLDLMFAEHADFYHVNKRTLEYIAYCESRYRPQVTNGKHAGMYQFNPTTWIATRNRMGLDPNPDLRFDANEAIRTAAFKISNGGIGAWAVCSSKLASRS